MKILLLSSLFIVYATLLNAQTFTVVEGSFTWQEAKADAESRGGRLAVLDTQEKIDMTNSYLSSLGNWPSLWIGLTDEEVEGEWKWITGDLITAMKIGIMVQHRKSGYTREDYGHIFASNVSRTLYSWNDSPSGYDSEGPSNQNNYMSYLLETVLNDSDGDGLSDSVETNTGTYVSPTDTGTDPNNADTDGDGVSDGAEVLSTYGIVSGSYSWEEARLDALNRGGRLAVLSNENKLNQVMDLLVSEGDTLPRNRVWIGAQKVDGQWEWIDGTDWSLGFITPFLDPDGGQLYVTLTTAENHEAGLFDWPGYAWPWDSQFGDYSTSYILEKEGLGTDPNNADTDGDGVNDGDEVTNGRIRDHPLRQIDPPAVASR